MPTTTRARRSPCELHTAPGLVALAALSGVVIWAVVQQRRPGPPPPPETMGLVSKLDPNSATLIQLQGLPGIGPAKARAILAYRNRVQPPAFRSLDDLCQVPGIGPATLRRVRPHLVISGPAPHQG